MAKSIKAQLKEIAQGVRVSERQKMIVREQSRLMGVAFVERHGCGNCYQDQAVVLWRIMCEQEKPKDAKWVLRAGVDVRWKGERVNATCSEKRLAELYRAGFPREFYSKIGEE